MTENPKYKMTAGQIKWADKLAKRRSDSIGDKNTRTSVDPNTTSLQKHKVGARAEVVYSIHTGYPVDDKTIGTGDTGTDFPDGAQVKGTDIKSMPNILIPIEQWSSKPPKFYVLIWVQNPKFNRPYSYILGKISREKARNVREFKPKGFMNFHCDNWVIWNRFLEPVGPGIPQDPDNPIFKQLLEEAPTRFAGRPYPLSKPGDCINCPAMGGWKPYDDESMHCFHSAKYLKKAAPPVICTEAVKNCPRMEEHENLQNS